MEQVLKININLKFENETYSDDENEFDSDANLDLDTHRLSSMRRDKKIDSGSSATGYFMQTDTPLNVDFRTFVVPPIPQDE